VSLKVVTIPRLSFAPFYIAAEEGYFEEQRLDVEFVEFKRSSEALAPLIQGKLDAMGNTIETGTLNAIARGAKIKMVADKGHVPPSGCDSQALVARAALLDSGELHDAGSLAGLRVSINPASFTGYYCEKLLSKAGLTLADIDIHKLSGSVELDALGEGSIDVVATSEPWITRMVQHGDSRAWRTLQDIVPGAQHAVVVFGPTMLGENSDVGRRFMVAYLKAVRQYNDGKTERNLEILEPHSEMDRELLELTCWPAIRDDGKISLDSVLDFQNWAVQNDLVEVPVSGEDIWDASFVEHAIEVLGP
jgi:NitT/TauT family transport system substrate-binding protein